MIRLFCLALLCVTAASAQAPDTLTVGQARIWSLTSGDVLDHSPVWSPDGDTVAFVRGQASLPGDDRIWIKASDGSGSARQVSFGEGSFDDWYPAFSPDGRHICFSSSRDSVDGIWIVALDGGAPALVAGLAVPHGGVPPAWSPDGHRIAYSNEVDGNSDIYTVAVAGGAPQRITTDPAEDRIPSWSIDGGTLIYGSSAAPDDIFLISAEGGVPRRIATGLPGVSNPRLSPDGRWILFRAGLANSWHTWIIPATGGTPLAVTASDSLAGWMADWSPDGSRIAYTRGRIVGWGQLVVTPAQGGASRTLADSVSMRYSAPEWSPDGRHIAILGVRRDLLTVDVATGRIDTVALAATHRWLATASWSPDGEWLAFCSQRLGLFNIWIVPAGGGEAEAITLGPGTQAFPVWAADGETIAYAHGGPGDWDLWSTTVWGDPPVPLLIDDAWSDAPQMIHTGSGEVIFWSTRPTPAANGLPGYWAVPMTGGPPRWLATDLFRTTSGAMARDLQHIVEDDPTTGSIWIRDALDGSPRLLLTDAARMPRFSPDNTLVSYVRAVDSNSYDIYIADVRAIVGSTVVP